MLSMEQEQELAADEFALALLMPAEEFHRKVREFSHDGICDTDKVAKYFGVSISLASWYGKKLKLFMM